MPNSKKQDSNKRFGHAVVLVDYTKDYLRFMNSWGSKWADGGFFKVANTDVLKAKYYDVYYDESDLTDA